MAELSLPIDFERQPEFRSFFGKVSLRLHEMAGDEAQRGLCGCGADALAVFIFLRLWTELSYQAQVGALGLLGKEAAVLFMDSLGPVKALEPLRLLCESGILAERDGDETNGTNGTNGKSFHCERFARHNEHLSPQYRSGQSKGAAHSAHVRSRDRLAHEAMQQVMLLPAAMMKRRDGKPLQGTEINRTMLVIKTLDNCLKLPSRNPLQISEGLIADAADVMDRYSKEQLEATYLWIIDHRGHPALPKTTEQLLANFGALAALTEK